MRRTEKEIKDKDIIEWILKEAQVCRIALCDNNKPYIVPMNFVFKDNYLYLHSANEGKKIAILNRNRNICFEVDIKNELITSENVCNYGMKYYSVIGSGKAKIIEDNNKKKKILDNIIQKYTENYHKSFKYPENTLKKTAVIKVELTELTGKKSGY